MARRFWAFVFLLGRLTTYALGLVVLTALVLGPLTVVLAAPGGPLKLGRNNAAGTRATTLVSNLAGSVLRLTNNGSGPALDLRVQAGAAPLLVNSSDLVDNLNADLLDGKTSAAFVQPTTPTYEVETEGADGALLVGASCDDGDLLKVGGHGNVRNAIVEDSFGRGRTWFVELEAVTGAGAASVEVRITCYDFAPLR